MFHTNFILIIFSTCPQVLEGQTTAQGESCQLVLNINKYIFNLEQFALEITTKTMCIMEGMINSNSIRRKIENMKEGIFLVKVHKNR